MASAPKPESKPKPEPKPKVDLKVDLPPMDAKLIASKRPSSDGAREFLSDLIDSVYPEMDEKEKAKEMNKAMSNFSSHPASAYGDVFVVATKMGGRSHFVTSLCVHLSDTMKQFVEDIQGNLDDDDNDETTTDFAVRPTLFCISSQTGILTECDEVLYQAALQSNNVLDQQFAFLDTRIDSAVLCKKLAERMATIYK